MKRIFTFLAAVLLTASVFAQSPEKMSYQAVVRDASDNLVTNQAVGMQISILLGSASGTPVYTETQSPQTNTNGLVSLEIGAGTSADDFSTIDWSADTYFIKTETDPAGGTSYTIIGTSQLMSVPYALHSKTAETVTGGITETDPVYLASEAANITASDISNLGNLSNTNTGDQDLSSLASKTALGDSTALVRSEIPIAISDLAMNANSQNITNLAEPINAQDAATKAYVDALLERVEVLEESYLVNNGFTDERDSNHYNVVKIGEQIWMAENLKYLPSVAGRNTVSINAPFYYVNGYNGTNINDAKATYNYQTYGALYNWKAAMNSALYSSSNPSGVQGVCPSGWHLPSRREWEELTDFLGGESVAAAKLIDTTSLDWINSTEDCTNETGFTALPAGSLDGYRETFNIIGYSSCWWSTTQYYWYISPSTFHEQDYDGRDSGMSVRCVKD
jgi:uncharacterized protein (TIGR02145 family)